MANPHSDSFLHRAFMVLVCCAILAFFWSWFNPVQFLATSFDQSYYNRLVQVMSTPSEESISDTQILDNVARYYATLQNSVTENTWVQRIKSGERDMLEPHSYLPEHCERIPKPTEVLADCEWSRVFDEEGCPFWDCQSSVCPDLPACAVLPEHCTWTLERDENDCIMGCGEMVCDQTMIISRFDDFEDGDDIVMGEDDVNVLSVKLPAGSVDYWLTALEFELKGINQESQYNDFVGALFVGNDQQGSMQVFEEQSGKALYDDLAIEVPSDSNGVVVSLLLDTLESSEPGTLQARLIDAGSNNNTSFENTYIEGAEFDFVAASSDLEITRVDDFEDGDTLMMEESGVQVLSFVLPSLPQTYMIQDLSLRLLESNRPYSELVGQLFVNGIQKGSSQNFSDSSGFATFLDSSSIVVDGEDVVVDVFIYASDLSTLQTVQVEVVDVSSLIVSTGQDIAVQGLPLVGAKLDSPASAPLEITRFDDFEDGDDIVMGEDDVNVLSVKLPAGLVDYWVTALEFELKGINQESQYNDFVGALFVGNDQQGSMQVFEEQSGKALYDDLAIEVPSDSNGVVVSLLLDTLESSEPGTLQARLIDAGSNNNTSFENTYIEGAEFDFVESSTIQTQSLSFEQEVPTFITLTVQPGNMDIESVFAGEEENIQIIKDNNGKYWIPQFNLKTIPLLELGQGYIVTAKRDFTMNIIGEPVEFPVNITVENGWNLIGLPIEDNVDARCFLTESYEETKTPLLIRDVNQNRLYFDGAEFLQEGNIQNLTPGVGYQFYNFNENPITLTIDPENTNCLNQ
jgi:hypothetical protein